MPMSREDDASPGGVEALERATRVIGRLDERFADVRAGVLVNMAESVVERTWVKDAPLVEPYIAMAKADARHLRAVGGCTSRETCPCRFAVASRTGDVIQYTALYRAGDVPFLLSVAVGRGGTNLELLRRTLNEALATPEEPSGAPPELPGRGGAGEL
jgi:hypothetical protein